MMGMCMFAKWWAHTSAKTIMLLMLIFVTYLPTVRSDDPRLLDDAHDAPKANKFMYAEINISFMDPDNKKEVKRSFQGKYGTASKIASVSGTVMHAVSAGPKRQNHFGCSNYVNEKFPSETWIAMVERGACVFTEKIRIATKNHNASAIVIYNNASADDETVMDHIDISSISIFIFRRNGLEIANLLDRRVPVHMDIWPGKEGSVDPANSINKTSVLFVSISFIVLMIISLAWLVFYYIQRFRYSHAKERLARRLACAAKKAIAKIPQKTVKAGDKELDPDFDQCAVCIESYKAHDDIRILPCRHVFHKSCVDPWLLDQRSCPMCKLDILRAYGMQIGGSQESMHADPESGVAAVVVPEDPEVSSNAGEAQADERKVLLVSRTCLHMHVTREESGESAMEDSALGAVGGILPSMACGSASTSLNSIHSRSSTSVGNSRAEKQDLARGTESEKQTFMSEVKGNKWEEDEEEDVEDDKNGMKIFKDEKKESPNLVPEVIGDEKDLKKIKEAVVDEDRKSDSGVVHLSKITAAGSDIQVEFHGMEKEADEKSNV